MQSAEEKDKKKKGTRKSKKSSKDKRPKEENNEFNLEDIQPDARLMRQFEEGAAGDFARLLHDDWSFDEDKLIVAGHFFDPPISLKAMEKRYMTRQKRDPIIYNKTLTVEMIRSRLNELQQQPHRLTLLKRDVEIELERQAAQQALKKPPPSANEEDKAAEAEPEEELFSKISLVLVREGEENQYVTVEKSLVASASDVLKSSVDTAMLVAKKGEIPTVTIDSSLGYYAATLEYKVVDVAVFHSLVRFLEEQDIVSRQVEIEKLLERNEKERAESSENILKNIDETRKRLIANAKSLCSSEERAMKEALEREFENEIREYRMKHNRRLHECLAAIKKKWDNLQDQLEAYTALETEAMRKMMAELEDKDRSKLIPEAEMKKKKADALFTPEMTMKLAILAEILHIEKLREAVRTLLVRNIFPYVPYKEWQCTIVRDVLPKEVLVHLRIQTIIALQKIPVEKNYISPALLTREIKLRKLILRDAMKKMDKIQLREVIDKGECPFPDIIDEIITFHEGGGQGQDERLCLSVDGGGGENVSFDFSLLTATTTHFCRYSPFRASRGVRSGTWGRWYFEVTINTLDESAGSSISVGWDVARDNLEHGPIPGLVVFGEGYGCCLQNNGQLHKGGHGEYINCSFSANDVVGVSLDVQSNSVAFYLKSGKVKPPQDSPTTSLGTMEIRTGDFRIGSPNYHLFPAACMYSVRGTRMCSVTFNFTGPFKHIPPTFEPLAKRE